MDRVFAFDSLTGKMIMKKSLFALAMACAVLAGCGEKAVDGQTSAQAPDAPEQSSQDAPKLAQLDTPLPDGISLPFRYHVRADRMQPLDENSQLRLIDIDVLDLDKTAADREIAKMLAKAGFRGSSPSPSKGGTRTTFRRPDGGKVSVITWDKKGRKVHARGAKSSAYMGWTVPVNADATVPTSTP